MHKAGFIKYVSLNMFNLEPGTLFKFQR